MLKALTALFRRQRSIARYPAAADRPPPYFRGMPEIDVVRCRGHAACARACPSGAIAVEGADDRGWRWSLDRARCVGCGLCAEVCPTGALSIRDDFELAARRRDDLVATVDFFDPTVPRLSRGGRLEASDQRTPDPAAALRRRAARVLGGSLHLRHLDVGSDNGAEWELNALLNPIYDLQRLGIDVVASPRHADLLLVTGAVTRNSAAALVQTYEATPEPRLVVAVGTDACGGGVVGPSYATAGGVDRLVPVDVYVPGDPPRPQAIIHGLLLALDRRQQRIAGSHEVASARGPRATSPPS